MSIKFDKRWTADQKEHWLDLLHWLDLGGHAKDSPIARKFDMNEWHCQTTACIGGTLEALCRAKDPEVVNAHIPMGISPKEMLALFYCDNLDSIDFEEVTPEWAFLCVRKFVETNVIDWEGTRPKPKPKVVVVIRGGVLVSAWAEQDMEVKLFDFDDEDCALELDKSAAGLKRIF